MLAAWTLVTGAFHEDGWVDCLDAAFAPVGPEQRHAILKDPRVGAHGLIGGVALMIVRFATLAAVPRAAILVAPTVGRWAMVASLARFHPARPTGLGAVFAADPRPWTATLAALVILAAIGWATGSARPAAALGIGAAAGLAVGAFLSRRFGGLTGDGHGAVGLAAETAALLAYAVEEVW